ncbi:hypothetical protein AYO41_03110 [Verrucomicrobia bacterium SCGC AG-212-E04]|nr:hypothetical protein AYO41_03110 [Verrucomicrobia bacterium SCGC AG-212-E04]
MKSSAREMMTLGILDWGIGGLGFFRLWRARHPRGRVVYWSDAGVPPYGRLSANDLAARVDLVVRAMGARGVTHLALACHAASSILPKLARGRSERPLLTGIIEHGVAATRALHRPGLVGIMGGRRTILSGMYLRAFRGLTVRQRIAQPLSAHIEAGNQHSPAARRDLERIMAPLRRVDTLVLACTHYPALGDAIQAQAPRARIIDPASSMLRWIERHWPPARQGARRDEFLTTGDPKSMRRAAKVAFGETIAREIEVIRL